MRAAPRIPKVLHLYWDGSSMSFLQYLTVKSFLKHNQGWKIKLYVPALRNELRTWESFEQKDPYLGKNYFDRVLDMDIEIISVDLQEKGFRNDVPEVVKSDYLRYRILGEEGGYWSDFDVLFFNSIQSLYDGDDPFPVYGDSRNIDTILCPVMANGVIRYYTIGFLASSPENPFFSDLADACSEHLDLKNYQSIGVNMIKKIYPDIRDIKTKYQDEVNLLVLPHQIYLPLEYNQTGTIFEHGGECIFPKFTIGIHWFNGHPDAKRFQNKLGDPGAIVPEKGKIFEYLRPYLVPVRLNKTFFSGSRRSKIAETFTETYQSNLWGDDESKSGTGSRLSATAKIRRDLQALFLDFNIETILDIGCGDFNWMRLVDFSHRSYTGVDVVETLISGNISKYSKENISFKLSNCISDPVGKYDLVILRDVLVHLTMEDAFCVLKNITESGSRYLLTTSFTADRNNRDLKYSASQWRTLSLHKYPFCFPEPTRVINEGCQEANGLFDDKSLVLFEISALQDCIEKFEVSPLWLSIP